MKVNNEDILKLVEEEKQYIDHFVLETTKGTKTMKNKFHQKAVEARNQYISSKIKEYSSYHESLISEIHRRANKLFPQNNEKSFIEQELKINKLKNIFKLKNKYASVNYKLGLTKLIYDLNDFDHTNLLDINIKIKEIIDIFNKASIPISLELFSYSPYTYQYMKCFLDNVDSSDFNAIIQDEFKNIYWECPKLIEHLRLNFDYIVNHYQKELNHYCDQLVREKLLESKVSDESLFAQYNELSSSLNEEKSTDGYLLLEQFLNRKLVITDYLEDSSLRISNYNHLAKNNNFEELSSLERQDFYIQVKELGNILKELRYYYLFEPIIENIRKLKKDDQTKNYDLKLKVLSNEEKKREKLYHKYLSSLKGNIFKKVNLKEVEKNKVNLIHQIDLLSELYKEIDDMELEVSLSRYIDDTSTIYDLLLVVFSSYKYLKKIYKNIYLNDDYGFSLEYFMDELFEYLFNYTNSFIYKTPIDTNLDIRESISNKFNLLNINISIEELSKDNLFNLEEIVKMVITINNINQSSITLDDILFIYESENI